MSNKQKDSGLEKESQRGGAKVITCENQPSHVLFRMKGLEK